VRKLTQNTLIPDVTVPINGVPEQPQKGSSSSLRKYSPSLMPHQLQPSTSRLHLLDRNSLCLLLYQSSDISIRARIWSIDLTITEVRMQDTNTEMRAYLPTINPDDPSSFRLSRYRFFALNAWFARAFNGTVSQSYDLPRGSL